MTKPFKVTVTLSQDDLKLIRLIATDLPVKAIASDFNISTSAMTKRITGMFYKIGVRGRLPLALWAVKNGIVKL